MDANKKVGFAVSTTIEDPRKVLLGKTLTEQSDTSVFTAITLFSPEGSSMQTGRTRTGIFKAVISDRSLGVDTK